MKTQPETQKDPLGVRGQLPLYIPQLPYWCFVIYFLNIVLTESTQQGFGYTFKTSKLKEYSKNY